jgi:hypothetical protein
VIVLLITTLGPNGHLEWKSGDFYKGQVSYSVSGKYTIRNYLILRDGYVSNHFYLGDKLG